MKPHITIQFKQGVSTPHLPHWGEIIRDKSRAAGRFGSAVDRIFDQHQLPFWVAAEYKMQGPKWQTEELNHGLNRVYRFVLRANKVVPQSLIRGLLALPEVEKAETGQIAKTQLPETHAKSMSTNTSDEARRQIGVQLAHQLFTQGHPDIVVAVLDTGVDLSHPELQGALVPGFDFVDVLSGAKDFFGDSSGEDDDPDDELVGHGTHVAGIIAGRGLRMPKGVAPRCKIMPVRVLGSIKEGDRYVGAGLIDNINNGIKWAVDNGAHIINMSLGVRHEQGGPPHREAIEYAKAKGVTVVAASGNDGTQELYYPGALPHVICVGAVDESDRKTAFSTWGKVTFTAPGTQIWSSHAHDDYAFATGTSQAAPFVAGAAALLRSWARENGRDIDDRWIKGLLKRTADHPGKRIKDKKHGYGRINLPDALRLLQHKINPPHF